MNSFLSSIKNIFSKDSSAKDIIFYNTLGRKDEKFTPLEKGIVKMYHCGPTVYDFPHIGNLRSYVFADTLKRLFLSRGFSVQQVINITDVGHLVSDGDEGEDKIEKMALQEGKTAQEIARFYEEVFFKDLTLLNVNTEGTIFPRATEHIPEQITLIEKLEKKGFVYKTSDGMYFDTSHFPTYGSLGVDIKGLSEGARVEKNLEKKNPTDFALWKFSPQNSRRQQEWPSPWGVGFPGWHIECSAMSMKYLGETFDIHTGGEDHIQVHHTNEIAQSEGATGKAFAHYWLHNGFITVDGKKMSKSLGNFYTLKNLAEKGFSPLAYRYWLLTGNYRRQVNFTLETLAGAEETYKKLKEKYASFPKNRGSVNSFYKKQFDDALSNNLSTPKAIATLQTMLKDKNVSPEDKSTTLSYFDSILGLGISL